jgi:Spy/CpxP family protein refolding chaperone
MRMTKVMTIGAAAAVWLGASLAGAQPAGAPGGRGPGGFMAGRMARVLNLSDDQKTAFQKVLEQQRPQMQALHQQLRDNHGKLEEALKGDNPDPAAVGQLVIQGRALMKQGEGLREQTSQALRGLLTPDQQTKFDALQSLRRGGGFGPMGGRGGFGIGAHGRWDKPAPPPQQ